jgi:hypothetical protein
LNERIKHLEEQISGANEEIYDNIELLLNEYATKELLNTEIASVHDAIEQSKQDLYNQLFPLIAAGL